MEEARKEGEAEAAALLKAIQDKGINWPLQEPELEDEGEDVLEEGGWEEGGEDEDAVEDSEGNARTCS